MGKQSIMSSTQRFPTQQLKQLRADLTVVANTLKTLTAMHTVQMLSDTLSGMTMSNATTPYPHFNTVTVGDLYCLDRDGNAVRTE